MIKSKMIPNKAKSTEQETSRKTAVSSPVSSPPSRPKRGRRPKAKGMPNRPLSAYNLFFKAERKLILKDNEQGTARPDYLASAKATQKPGAGNMGPAKFQAIARTIAGRWKALGEEDRKIFEDLAIKEMEAYKIKKEEYHRKLVLERGAISPTEVDSLNESRSTKGSKKSATAKNDTAKAAPTKGDTLLGKTVSMSSPSGMEPALLLQQPVLANSLEPGLTPFSGLHGGMGFIPGDSRVAALLQQHQGHGNDNNLYLALQIQELRRREQAILVAERMHRQRQMLHEHRLLQAHLALQQQAQTAMPNLGGLAMLSSLPPHL